jgi:hypothetical protein
MTIPVYQSEFDDGLAEAIKSSASIAYTAEAKPYTPSASLIEKINSLKHPAQAKADSNDWDLFWLNSILVSVGWNKNDDVFDAGETFAARNSPVHKQFNFMHNEKDIIGHMTASIVLDSKGNVIPDSVDTVPTTFDIAVASVLYAQWGDPELQERMDKIIAGIAENKWFVSMECLFRGFDYAVVTPEGKNEIVPRTEASAFLTKHLRIYGGTGEYEGNKLGRMLRNFTFSGKGLVDNPANPNSIIFNGVSPFEVTKGASDVKTTINFPSYSGEQNMSDINAQAVAEAKADTAKAEQRLEKLNDKFEKMVEAAQLAEKTKVEKQIAGLEVDVEDLEKSLAEAKAANVAKDEAVAQLEKEFKALKAEKEELETTIAKAEADKAAALRVTQLVEVGSSVEEAEALVERWADSSDEQFADVVEFTKSKFDFNKKDDKDDKKEKKDAKASDEDDKADEAAAADLESAKVDDEDEAALAAASTNEADDLHQSCVAWTESFLGGSDTDNDNK